MINIKNKTLLVLIFGILRFSEGSAQNSGILEAYIQSGIQRNIALQQQHLDLQKSMEAIKQSKSLFYPVVQFNASYTVAGGGRRIDFPIGDLLNPVYSALNQLTQSSQFPQLENQQIQFLPNNFQETKIKVAYPLFNSDLRYNRQIQELSLQSKTAQKAAYEQQLRYQITEAYLQYLQAGEAQKIWQNAKVTLEELRRFNQALVKNNVATKEIVMTAEYELNKADNEIFRLKTAQNTARAYFNFLLNAELQSEVASDTALLRRAVPLYKLEEMIAAAMANRQEFSALRSGQAAAETAVRLRDAHQKLPSAYIGGEMGFQGFGYRFSGDQAYALAQVGLTYDIYNGGKTKSQTQEAKIEADKLRNQYREAEQQIALQVTQAWNELETARFAWQTHQQGIKSASETHRIVGNKYKANQALLIELLDAQTRVTSAQLQASLAWVDVLIKEAALKKAAGMN